MSNFPNNFDDDITLPPVHDNLTEIGEESINALREAVFNIEQNLGLNAHGTTSNIAERIGISLEVDGSIKPSAIASMGLVTLPIDNGHISETAGIVESKLKLDYKTIDLYNYIKDLSNDVNMTSGWISTTGSKLAPHISGTFYNHKMKDIFVDTDTTKYLKNKFDNYRNNNNSYELVKDINTELLEHHASDSLPYGSGTVETRNGSEFPSNYGHTASGIYLQTERFHVIPQTVNDVQLLVEYLDNASIFLYGTRIQNLYSNGISKVSRSSSLLTDGYGTPIVPETLATAYFRVDGDLSMPWDDLANGDDIVQFFPDSSVLDNNLFDSWFAQVRAGDILRINYGGIQTSFIIKEKKYNSSSDVFAVRIAGKNLTFTENASARIDRNLVNDNKFGVLAVSAVNNEFDELPSLLVGNPRGAQTLGNGFNAAQFDETHYNLYLALFETGDPLDGYTILPPIDVTGNQGKTSGKYTLDSIVESTNNAFRSAGYNYRFMAFSYNGEFGIMLADSIGNAGFSIINAVVDELGVPNETETLLEFPNNVIGVFTEDPEDIAPDPLGFGSRGSGSSSPPFVGTYGSPESAYSYTKLFLPLNRNNYYVNGVERDKFPLQPGQAQDEFGDGYWEAIATLESVGSTVEIKYTIDADLSQSGLDVGKTIVIKDTSNDRLVNSGRYIIKSATFDCAPDNHTEIVVYDAVHAISFTPAETIDGYEEYPVSLYFDTNSPSFNIRSATDFSTNSAKFKRYFEVYSDQDGNIFTHERARFVIVPTNTPVTNSTTINDSVVLYSGSVSNNIITKFNIINISPKLKGYAYNALNKITLFIESYVSDTGVITGYLCDYDGSLRLKRGPTVVGKIGQKLRFYDSTYIDHIDFYLNIDDSVSDFSNVNLDIQLFNSLNSDHEVMMISSCQLNDVTKKIQYLEDKRQFGNTSEKDLTTSALNFISAGDRLLHQNGVIRGFVLESPRISGSNPNDNQIYLTGGEALVNGNIVQVNDELISIPLVREKLGSSDYNLQWLLCVNNVAEYKLIALRDYYDTLSTPDEDRNIKVINQVTNEEYYVESDYFENIIKLRKDLTILYIVESSITNDSGLDIDISVNDVRRYVNDVDSSLPLTLTTGEHQGNFRTATAVLKWLQFNNKYNGNANLRGATDAISSKIYLDTDSNIIIDGNNSGTITLLSDIEIGSNITFKNITINMPSNSFSIKTLDDGGNNILFENCVFTRIGTRIFEFENYNNVSFKNCSFTVTATSVLTSVKGLMSFTDCTNIILDNCNFNVQWSSLTPGNTIALDSCDNVIINKCSVNGEFQMAVVISDSSNITITNNSFDNEFILQDGTTLNAAGSLNLSTFSYDEDNIVNGGRGYIYCNVTDEVNNIIIDNNNFNNSNTTEYSTYGFNRLTFINFELSVYNAELKNIKITNNYFNDPISSDIKTNYRASIAIVNTSSLVTELSIFPRLTNCLINNNYSEQDQLILITSELNGSNMDYPGLVTTNTIISENTCGTIGYWISRGNRTYTTGELVASRGHHVGSLEIINNKCKFITCLNSNGTRFHANTMSTTYSNYGSGYVTIDGNKTCKINVGMAFDEESCVRIINNDLTAYLTQYFSKYGSNGIDGDVAISVLGNSYNQSYFESYPNNGPENMCIISKNTTSSGFILDEASQTVQNQSTYEQGLIYVNIPAIITDNILKGIGFLYSIINLYCNTAIVTGNKIYRNDRDIASYIFIQHSSSEYNKGTITNNYFDDYTVDGSNEKLIKWGESETFCPYYWTIHSNKNQTGYAQISLTDGHHFNHTNTSVNLTQTNEGGFQYFDWDDDEWYIKPARSREINGQGVPHMSAATPYNSNVLRIKDAHINGSGSFIPRRFSWKATVNNYVPDGVDVISASIGFKKFQGTFKTPTNGNYDSRFVVSITGQYSPSGAFSDSDFSDAWDLDHFSTADDSDQKMGISALSGLAIATGDNLNSSSDTYHASGNLNGGVVGKSTSIESLTVSLDAVWWCTNFDDHLDMLISPVVIKFRW